VKTLVFFVEIFAFIASTCLCSLFYFFY